MQGVDHTIHDTRKRMKQSNSTTDPEAEEESAKDLISSVWKDVENEEDQVEAFSTSSSLLNKQIEALVRSGLEAFHRCETAETEVNQLKDKMKQKDAELDRLRSAADKNAATLAVSFSTKQTQPRSCLTFSLLQNLISNADQSHKEAQDMSHRITVEANLRAELCNMVESRDEAITEAELYKRQALLLQEDLRNQKAKLASVTQEKILIARDLEAHRRSTTTPTGGRSQQGASSDFYKRTVSDLNSRLQASKIACLEKNRRIQQLEDEISRNTMKASFSGRDGSRKRKGH